MSIVDQGCTCASCSTNALQNLKAAREKWNNSEREITFRPYHYECGDGCCSEYGTNVYVNGFQLTRDGENAESVVSSLMEFLEIENVDIGFESEE